MSNELSENKQSLDDAPIVNAAASQDEAPFAMPEDRPAENQEPMPHMSIGEHLEDLRKRLFYAIIGMAAGLVVGLFIAGELIRLISIPFVRAMKVVGYDNPTLNATSVTDPFNTYLTVAFYMGLVLASPWIFYQIWMFIGAGLYKRERRYVVLAVPFSVGLFLLGAAFAIYISIPALEFFIRFGKDLKIDPIIRLNEYITFMTSLLLAFGIVFQMPLVVLVLAKIGMVSMRGLRKYRRHVVVAIAALSAVLAPPDPGSMIAMAVPMWLLYEFGVILSWWLVLRKREAKAKLEAQDDITSEQEI